MYGRGGVRGLVDLHVDGLEGRAKESPHSLVVIHQQETQSAIPL
jgi:hypothetical protein